PSRHKPNKQIFQTQQIITMKYYPKDLFTLLYHSKKKLSDRQRMQYCIDLVNIVFGLHKKQIAHGDLKLENILVNKKGKIVLTDFGFARHLTESLFSDEVDGTFEYLAPEGLQRCEKRAQPLDIWAIGCIIWRVLAKDNEYYYPWYPFTQVTQEEKINRESL